jgi:hypothetical protein
MGSRIFMRSIALTGTTPEVIEMLQIHGEDCEHFYMYQIFCNPKRLRAEIFCGGCNTCYEVRCGTTADGVNLKEYIDSTQGLCKYPSRIKVIEEVTISILGMCLEDKNMEWEVEYL